MSTGETIGPKRIVWLHSEIKTPPFALESRLEAGILLRRLQVGDILAMPESRPMPSIGKSCHELRVRDAAHNWRIVYRIDHNAIIVAGIFAKKTPRTPKVEIDQCKSRLKRYDDRKP